ncbi:twin-arginine translocation pathway signal [Antrihabitans sp. YC2-6]|uniref:twin-arginine translocation pathway signal n=1 Tax=Antrihabitans sp. YC2-6 TaxID=2799498 RepID=UPI0018F48C01|nr:twin-arginine translocation pathway signal [Antrihabitans sp. YC2-6]MBJ8343884.1 twin-arginine translocation pathway signal [Antrihabitans sp. YC2-6]
MSTQTPIEQITESASQRLSPSTSSGAVPVPAPRSGKHRRRKAFAIVISACLAVASIGTWTYLFFGVSPTDDAVAPNRQQVAVDAAATAATAILSYSADTVETDLGAANQLVTGTFGDYYRTFTRDVVVPAAKEKRISTVATVVGKAISAFSDDTASVLVFVNQSTTTAAAAEPTVTTTTIRIEVERHGDQWLVAKFDPS